MLELSLIKSNKERVLQGLKIRNFRDEDLLVIDQILELDETRRASQVELDSNLSESKQLSNEIGGLMKQGRAGEADSLKARVAALKELNTGLDAKMTDAADRMEELLLTVPNIPHSSVPAGKSSEDNEVFRAWDKPFPPLFDGAQPHWELAKKYNLFDLDLGVKLTGAGFPVYRGKGARLERALINFFLDEAVAAGYEEIQPPLMVNHDTAKATGQR